MGNHSKFLSNQTWRKDADRVSIHNRVVSAYLWAEWLRRGDE